VLVVAAVDMYGDLVSRASGHLATPIQRGLPLAAADLVRDSLLAQSWIRTVAIGHRESHAASSSHGSLICKALKPASAPDTAPASCCSKMLFRAPLVRFVRR